MSEELNCQEKMFLDDEIRNHTVEQLEYTRGGSEVKLKKADFVSLGKKQPSPSFLEIQNWRLIKDEQTNN